MTNQERQHIKNLSWDILIDAKISRLPVDVYKIAAIYNVQSVIDDDFTLYENMVAVSGEILKIYGMYSEDAKYYLAIRIMTPLIIIRGLGDISKEKLSELTGLPEYIANERISKCKVIFSSSGVFHLERIVYSQFLNWIKEVKTI